MNTAAGGTTDSQQLIEQIRQQNNEAWRELVAHHEPRLFAWMKSRLNDAALAEDLVQDVFLAFLRSLPNFDAKRPIEPFLNQIAAHLLIDTLRKQGRHPTFPLIGDSTSSEENPFPLPIDSRQRKASSLYRGRETRQGIEDCLASTLREFAARWQSRGEFERLKCCELLFAKGYSNQQAARLLNISEQAVANHKAYIIQHLKSQLIKAGYSGEAIPD